jgi:oligopeptide transport system permease protein
MARAPFRRLIGTVVTTWVVVTLAFVMVRWAPGGPFDREQALAPLVQANLERAYGLDQPVWSQYLAFLGQLAHGNLGRSLSHPDFSVNELLSLGLPISVELGALALLVVLVTALPLGILAATQAGRAFDRGLALLSAVGMAMPAYVLAPCLILVWAVHWHALPAGGWNAGDLSCRVLPVLSLALPVAAPLTRVVRVSVLTAWSLPHVVAARGKGLSEARILRHHVLPLALSPVLSALRPSIAALLTGSLVVETIFGLPGMGRYLVEGALNRDYPLLVGKALVFSLLVLASNQLIDLLQLALDPRRRRSSS